MYVHPMGVWGPLPRYKNWEDVPADYVGPMLSHHNEVLSSTSTGLLGQMLPEKDAKVLTLTVT